MKNWNERERELKRKENERKESETPSWYGSYKIPVIGAVIYEK